MTARSASCTPRESFDTTACLCICHFTPVACDDVACASTVVAAAVGNPYHVQPQPAATASSHRTARTFAIATPVGPTRRFAIR